MLLLGYARSLFRDFENYLRIVVGLDEDDIQLSLKQNKGTFITYQFSLGIYTIEDISKAVYTMGDHGGTLQIEYDNDDDDNIGKTKLFLTRSGSTFGTLRFDEKTFSYFLWGFASYWGYKPTNAFHADSLGVYTSEKNLNLSAKDKIHLKCVCIEGSVQNGVRQPILFSFILDKPSGYKVFCEPETIQYKKQINLF